MEFDSISFESHRPFKLDLFRTFVADMPVNVYRGKGILNITDNDHRCVFHLVGDRCVVTKGDPWATNEIHKTQLVLIGRQLSNTALQEQLTRL